MKYCYKCGETKPVQEYSKNKAKADGMQSSCKDCRSIRAGEPKPRLLGYKNGARRHGREWSLPDDIALAMLAGVPCHYGYTEHIGEGIDRVDSSKGYTEDNVVPCCWIHNKMKSDMTYGEFKEALKL